MKALIEETYRINNNTRVVIVAHSMGNPTALYFYNQMPQAWKDKYLEAHISLAGVWMGALKPMRLFASGNLKPLFCIQSYFSWTENYTYIYIYTYFRSLKSFSLPIAIALYSSFWISFLSSKIN